MPLANCVFQALTNGLMLALMAPPIAGVTFLLIAVASAVSGGQGFKLGVDHIVTLAFGVVTMSYLVGIIPAFFAGLALPSLRKFLPAVLASVATGFLGMLAHHLLAFGFHWLAGSNWLRSISIYALPAFVGVAVAAFIAQIIEKRQTEA